VFLDSSRMSGGEANFAGLGFFEGYSCQAVFFLYGFDDVSLPQCEGIEAAVSKSSSGYTIRALSNSANSLYRFAVFELPISFSSLQRRPSRQAAG